MESALRPTTLRPSRAEALRSAADVFVRQHGVATRSQLIACGLSGRQIERRLAEGRLDALARGVYALETFPDTWERHAIAAVLVTAFRARQGALSHDSAATLWGLRGFARQRPIYVTAPAGDRHPNPLAVMCRASDLVAGDIVEGPLGVPTTSPVRTVLDLAVRTSRVAAVELLLDDVLVARLATIDALCARADAMVGRPGITTVRQVLHRRERSIRDERELASSGAVGRAGGAVGRAA